MVGHRNAVFHTPVEEPDYLEMEGRRHPHGVGIDEFLDDVGASVAALHRDHTTKMTVIRHFTVLLHGQPEVIRRFQIEEPRRPVPVFPSGRLMKVIQAEAPFRILTDG